MIWTEVGHRVKKNCSHGSSGALGHGHIANQNSSGRHKLNTNGNLETLLAGEIVRRRETRPLAESEKLMNGTKLLV